MWPAAYQSDKIKICEMSVKLCIPLTDKILIRWILFDTWNYHITIEFFALKNIIYIV